MAGDIRIDYENKNDGFLIFEILSSIILIIGRG